MITASESTEDTSRGIITGPPLASMPIRALRWCTSHPPSPGSVRIPGVWWLAAGAKRGSVAGWSEPLLLGQDELVRLGDVEPVFHALMHDDDLAAAVEEISALDARGRQERSTFP